MRLRKVKYAESFILAHPEYMILNPEEQRGKWNLLFKNENPIHIEIGCGKGQFLMEMAARFPNINFIGLEKFDSVIIRVLEKLLENPLPNLLLIQKDAANLESYFDQGEIERIYLHFSDPWPKKRQAKKRLTHPNFLSKYHSVLKTNHSLFFKSDNFSLFQYSLMTVNCDEDFIIKRVSLDLHAEEDIYNVSTEFEDKFVEQGHPIFYFEVVNKKEIAK